MGKAHAAFQAIPGRLLTSVAAGPWIRLYSFTSLPVLNAQLQAVISLQSYAVTAEDDVAASLAVRMQRAAAATLPRFDTGYWSYYALPHDPSPLDYHEYVVQLLQRLKKVDPRFAAAAVRFAAYEKQPPAFQLAPSPLGSVTFWLSKPATVSAVSGAGPSKRVTVDGGWHTFAWGEPKRAGAYSVHVNATDAAGNHASFDALPFVRVTRAPKRAPQSAVTARRANGTPFLVGAAVTDPSQGTLPLVRLSLTWPTGATAIDAATTAQLQAAASTSAVVELAASPLPVDDAGRAALAQYASSIVAALPTLRSLVLTPAPTGATGPDYGAALSAIRTALPDAPLGLALDGSADPAGGAAALAGAPVGLVAFRPAPAAGKGLWTLSDLATVRTGFPDAEIVIDGAPAPLAAALETAACTPGVSGVVLDREADATRAGLQGAIRTAERGAFVCPGTAFPVTPLDLTLPTDGSTTAPVTLSLRCDRDCLYLVTLDRSDGRPVAALRGQLPGGAAMPVSTLKLPKVKLAPGSYRLDVRLVARVNPGAIFQQLAPLALR
jgi:hypothetical protein